MLQKRLAPEPLAPAAHAHQKAQFARALSLNAAQLRLRLE